MLLATRKKPVIKISEITFDLEIINPIESKNLFGGCTYSSGWDCGCGSNWNENPAWDSGGMGFIGFSSSGNSGDSGGGCWGNDYNNYDLSYDNGNGLDNYDYFDSNGDGILDADDLDNNGINDSEQYGLPNLPANVEQQLGAMGACVSYSMAFISSYLGQSITGATMALQNSLLLNVSLQTTMFTGLSINQSNQVIQSYFNTIALTTTAQIINAVNTNQHGVIVNVNVLDANNNVIVGLGHSVAIVNYDSSTSLFTVYDSNSGSYATYSSSDINFSAGVFEITGIKP